MMRGGLSFTYICAPRRISQVELVMRYLIISVILSALAAAPSKADAPNSIVSLLGPSVGYLLGQSDLCEWGLTDKIEQTYKASFQAIGMSAAQQSSAWEQAKARRAGLASMPAEGKARMKADTCTAEFRARFEQDMKN
jgi:hypothetical protein